MLFFPCWAPAHKHHTAPTATLQLEARGILGSNKLWSCIALLIPAMPSHPLAPSALQETVLNTRSLSGLAAVWKRGWKWISTSYGFSFFCPLNCWRHTVLCMEGLGIFGEMCMREVIGLVGASVPRQQLKGRWFPSQQLPLGRSSLACTKEDPWLLGLLLVNLKREKIMRDCAFKFSLQYFLSQCLYVSNPLSPAQ